VQGYSADDDALAVDVLAAVMDGTHISRPEHTLRYLKAAR
jgi:hypothetical protein